MLSRIVLFACIILQLALASTASAETRYVSDELTITLRTGKGNEFKILKMLETGTPLEVLERTEHYVRVREPGGAEGWVHAKFLTADTPKPQIIARLEKENARLKSEMEQVRESYRDVDARIEKFQGEIASLEQAKSKAETELGELGGAYDRLRKGSENVADLLAERDRLQQENQQLSTEVTALREGARKVLRTGMIKWFLAGAGVLFLGWVAGKLSRRKPKRSGW